MQLSTLVLLHGYPFDHSMWDKMLVALDSSQRVLTPDLRGFGQTPPGSSPPSLDLMADDVQELLTREKVERAVVCGFSMGGYVALAFAERHGATLAGLGLINSQAAADTEEGRAGRRAMMARVRREGAVVAAAAALPKLFGATQAGSKSLATYVERGVEKAGKEGIVWALEAMARRPDRQAVLKSLRVPILVLHTAADQFVPVDRARALAAQLPTATYLELTNAGHASPLEAPAEVAAAIKDLLRQC